MPLISTHDAIFQLREDETLLEGLERTGHEIEYQCRSGYCGACRTKILDGRVDYDELPMAFLMPDEILPCCCKVKEDIRIAISLRRRDPDLFGFGDDLFEQ